MIINVPIDDLMIVTEDGLAAATTSDGIVLHVHTRDRRPFWLMFSRFQAEWLVTYLSQNLRQDHAAAPD